MIRTRRLPVFLGLAAGAWGLSAGAQANPPVPAPAPRYLVRYLCFTMTPKPGALFPEPVPALPPILNKLNSQYGWSVPLTSDARQFLARLGREDPRYTYRLDLAGQSALAPDAPCRLLSGPRPDDPQGCRIDFTLSLLSPDAAAVKPVRANTLMLMKMDPALPQIDPAALLHTHTKGMYYWISAPGYAGSGLDDTEVPQGNEQILGRTRCLGADGNASHKQAVFVYCILPASVGA